MLFLLAAIIIFGAHHLKIKKRMNRTISKCMLTAAVALSLGTSANAQNKADNSSRRTVPAATPAPAAAPAIEIISATWGVGAKQADVTAKVKSLIKSGQLKFEVRNHILEADPAKGEHKQLKVEYMKDGKKMSKTFTERSFSDF